MSRATSQADNCIVRLWFKGLKVRSFPEAVWTGKLSLHGLYKTVIFPCVHSEGRGGGRYNDTTLATRKWRSAISCDRKRQDGACRKFARPAGPREEHRKFSKCEACASHQMIIHVIASLRYTPDHYCGRRVLLNVSHHHHRSIRDTVEKFAFHLE